MSLAAHVQGLVPRLGFIGGEWLLHGARLGKHLYTQYNTIIIVLSYCEQWDETNCTNKQTEKFLI